MNDEHEKKFVTYIDNKGHDEHEKKCVTYIDNKKKGHDEHEKKCVTYIDNKGHDEHDENNLNIRIRDRSHEEPTDLWKQRSLPHLLQVISIYFKQTNKKNYQT